MPSRQVSEELTRAFTTHLGDETTMTPIVDEGLQNVVSHTTLGASRRAGRQLLVVLPHIGPPGDQPAEHQSEAHPIPTATNINRLFIDLTDAPPDAGAAATADAALWQLRLKKQSVQLTGSTTLQCQCCR